MKQGSFLKRFLQAAGGMSLLVILMLLMRMSLTGSTRYSFIPGNLALAWAGFFFAWLLCEQLRSRRWLSWQNVVATILWLFFLPNSWYVLTDFIHLFSTGEVSVLYDIVLLSGLVLTGFTLGFYSLYIMHKEFIKRFGPVNAYRMVEAVILLSSFAIYLGRLLRWNSWDVLANPGGLIVDVSNRVIDPLAHPSAINITGLFFIFLSVCYWGIWKLAGGAAPSKTSR